ncbi:MAG: BREX-1 system adenine-specific DNA-methyltransferase PglX, partial [Syntrophaceae bacterium]|nr:BREX-1 system adenine-specific DNA-methyltransferase PglX [Syntrophaceae bacterium]
MAVVTKEHRRLLEKAVLDARDGAETAARKTLKSLGVDEPDAPAHLSPEQRELRRSLRAQGRQLGDTEDPHKKGRYLIDHLAEKIAYDQWHRLLFARFLLENNFLISPRHGVPVSFEDCRELAPELGRTDGWDVAAAFTASLLPQIFRPDDPAGRIVLAPEERRLLRQLVSDLPQEVFLADDALGWVYQFWQARRKDAVNHSEKKIGADELAAVTQLFTEDYMVLFLLHNTLGAWWTAKRKSAGQSESLTGYEFTYLRKREDGTPAAGAFDGWPRAAKDLRFLDPSMGSGHFLVFALPMLVAMRKEEEGLTNAEACDAVLRENLYGLELDTRCTQIAAFNLALAAWKLSGYRPLPPLNIACCGLGIHAREDEWLKLTNGDKTLVEGMKTLYGLFSQAPVLGSLIDPRQVQKDLLSATFEELEPLLEKVLEKEEKRQDENVAEMGVTARGLVHAAEILTGSFHLIATNVPYLGRGKQDAALKEFCETDHKDAKADLATCFVERCLIFCEKGGTTALVTPQNWLFLTTYKKLRQKLLVQAEWNFVARLGPRAFETIGGEVVNVTLLSLTNRKPTDIQLLTGLDVAEEKTPAAKAAALLTKPVIKISQKEQLANPDARITLEDSLIVNLLQKYASGHQGVSPADFPHYGRLFWEVEVTSEWHFWQSTVDKILSYSGRTRLLWYNNELREAIQTGQAYVRGEECWGKKGVVVSQIRMLPVTIYTGEKFDTNCAIVIPKTSSHLPAIWSFCSSPEFYKAVRNIDQKLNVTNATLVKVPFDLAYWQKVSAEKYPNGLPKPHSDDPTQWLFNGHPKGSGQPLQVAVARLLGYRWPRQTGSFFTDCPALGPDGLETFADDDGIVCLNSVKGEEPAAERLR